MTKSKTTTSFRFDTDFIDLLDAWSFVSGKDKGVLLQEAFCEYTKMQQNVDIASKVKKVTEILK
ncbi:hypothetical protein MH117_04935 [Paenibacillus sp. ACRRX]|uniref:hypothetical protein n=1 Tax=Paenibacillus sp. ACRRX TaxID=2918206 RepID=UPI001EF4C01A|nr:hypothetical protein [Paenibacillus sp. ACRRX]MCG7406755.1 hypothetical protein [Paenibacillus sp. ACRRX]